MNDFDQKLAHLVREALAEDIGDGDHSTLSAIPAEARGKAVLKIKENGVLAGVEVAEKIFRMQEPGILFQASKKDGDPMKVGEQAFTVEARVHTILQCERLVLNCMQRMSGIATLTRQYTDALKPYHTRVLDTRKTTPNFRLLEKEGVRIGGGINHRFGLYDMIMLKDNHVDFAGGITSAIERTRSYLKTNQKELKVEIEVRNLEELEEVLAVGQVDRIMLDNFTPELLKEAIARIGGRYETEASGGITRDTLRAFAETGVDFISVGALTHSFRSLDLSLKAVFHS